MILLAAIVAFVVAAAVLWWAFGPWDDGWYVEGDRYVDSPLWRTKR